MVVHSRLHLVTDGIDVTDLAAAIAEREAIGYRLDTIMPADDPVHAWMSDGSGATIELHAPPRGPREASNDDSRLVVRRGEEGGTGDGRAGMAYRDLVPGRFGGKVIASHISIESGGPTADYPHHHEIDFQAIVCVAGWVDVVYEDQGPPFRMVPGDCVVQPPTIGHRVLASSAGLAVLEVASPSSHPTHRRHDLTLPTGRVIPDRDFVGQRFVRHIAADSDWVPMTDAGCEQQSTGIGAATGGAGDVNFIRIGRGSAAPLAMTYRASAGVLLVQAGEVSIDVDGRTATLETDDSVSTSEPDAAIITGIAESSEVVLVSVR